jgi:hypothetical protein
MGYLGNNMGELNFFAYLDFFAKNFKIAVILQLTRVNSTNVLDEGLRIGEIGRRMNSKVKLVEIGVYRK